MAVEKQMKHLNSNLFASISIETTNDDPRTGDIVEICVIIADNFVIQSKNVFPFYVQIAPFRPEAIDFETASCNKTKIQEAMVGGLEPSLAADRFEEWVIALNMPEGKRIVPIVYNWPVVSGYLQTWLGFHHYKYLISHEYRDIMGAVLFMNDRYNLRTETIPFPRPEELAYVAALNDMEFRWSDDVMVKASKMIEIYRLLLGRRA